MNYPAWLPSALGIVLYVWQAWEFYRRGDYPSTLIYVCYAGALVGFVWQIKRTFHG